MRLKIQYPPRAVLRRTPTTPTLRVPGEVPPLSSAMTPRRRRTPTARRAYHGRGDHATFSPAPEHHVRCVRVAGAPYLPRSSTPPLQARLHKDRPREVARPLGLVGDLDGVAGPDSSGYLARHTPVAALEIGRAACRDRG